jgi:hypothetical protein
MNESAVPEERASKEREIKRLMRDAQRVNERVTGSFAVIRKAEGEWGKRSCGCRHAREELVNLFIKSLGTSLPQLTRATRFHAPFRNLGSQS